MARILVIDDDHSILSQVKLFLYDCGYEILCADSKREGLNLLNICRFDLVLVDLMMPDVTGFEFVQLVKGNLKAQDSSFAILTSKNDEKAVLLAKELDAKMYIIKPLIREEFAKKIATHFERHPPANHTRIEFAKPHYAEAKLCIAAHIVAVTELGVEILTESNLEMDQVIELSASLFQEIPLKSPLLRVLSSKPMLGGFNRVASMFVEPEADTVRKIQKWISYSLMKRREDS